jgi:hypothetical protein
VDGDGRAEVVTYTDVDPPYFAVKAFHLDGTQAAGFPKPTPGAGFELNNSVAIADLDGDGLLELGWLDETAALWVWDLTSPATAPRPWPMYGHDARHTASGVAAVTPRRHHVVRRHLAH